MSAKGRSRIKIWLLAGVMAGIALISLGPAAQAATPAEIKAAINKGVVWLAAQQTSDGSWPAGEYDPVGITALAVLQFENYAIETGYKTPFDAKYKYRTQVQKGLQFLFQKAVISTPIAANQAKAASAIAKVAPADTTISWSDWDQTYYTSLAMMAIASSKTPDTVVNVVNPVSPEINGMTYKEVLAAALNYLVTNQNPDGGWIYGGEFGSYSDQSNTGFAGLGLGYVSKFGLTVPDSTLHGTGEMMGLQQWNNYIQCTVQGTDFGGADYTEPCYWVNAYKTGHLMYNMALVGDMIGTTPPDLALSYIENVWYSTDWDIYGETALGFRLDGNVDVLACYAIMKGLVAQSVTTINPPGHSGLNWFDDMSTVIISYQQNEGYWVSGTYWFYGDPVISTVFALLTLERSVVAPKFQLTFPLQGYSAYTAPVQAVLDHSVFDAAVAKAKKRHKAKVAPKFYVKDGIVKAFNGEYAYLSDGRNRLDIYNCCLGYCNSYHTPFLYYVLNYVGGGIGAARKKTEMEAIGEEYGPNTYLYFDGHAGYDYVVPAGTPVLASFDGILRIARTDPVNGGGYAVYKTFYIDHDNGYRSWYLYAKLDPALLAMMQKDGYVDVNAGQVIGQTAESYLHFDVRLDGNKSENIVDPYSPVLWAVGPYNIY